MSFIETSYGSKPNLSDVHIDSDLILDPYYMDTKNFKSESGIINLNDCDLIGVKHIVFKDYTMPTLATASYTLRQEFEIKRVMPAAIGAWAYSNELIRIPSYFVSGSSIRVEYTSINNTGQVGHCGVYKYDPISKSITNIIDIDSKPTGPKLVNVPVNGGDYIGFYAGVYGAIDGDYPIKIYCDYEDVNIHEWDSEIYYREV